MVIIYDSDKIEEKYCLYDIWLRIHATTKNPKASALAGIFVG
jgi:hypothetical protein